MSDLLKDAEQLASTVSGTTSAASTVASTVGKVGGQILHVSAVPSIIERYFVFVLAAIAACAISFGSGYLYRAHVDAVKQSSTTAVIKTADAVASATVATADTRTDSKLQSRLNAANARAASLQSQIEAARNANPAPASCALPDGLRDALSRDLAGHSGQVQSPLQ